MCVNDNCTHTFCDTCITAANNTSFPDDDVVGRPRFEFVMHNRCLHCRCYANWRYCNPPGEPVRGSNVIGRVRYNNNRLALTPIYEVSEKIPWIALVHDRCVPISSRESLLKGLQRRRANGHNLSSVVTDWLRKQEILAGPLWYCRKNCK